MARKIAFIGAGSLEFTRELVRDILTFPALAGSTIALMDIHAERLAFAKSAVEKIVAAGNYPAKVIATDNRVEALKGADAVLCTILSGGVNVWRHDIEIPQKYGIDICVGDTRGPAGIFRALRTIPVMLDILKDVEDHCPEAVFLNYTNPMAMLCRAMQQQSKVKVTGLCHSVQGTAKMLAQWIGAPFQEITYLCAGINHMAWYLEYQWKGRDAYPLIREALQRPEIYNEEIVRNEMFQHLGYYTTESSGHSSEYNPWFRKRPDLIEKYCSPGTGWNPGHHAYILQEYLKAESTWRTDTQKWLESEEPVDLRRGLEYAAYILNATLGDGELYKFNGNVRNFGLVDNLPQGCCVEVPVLASPRGFEPIYVGPLPANVAIMTHAAASCEELAVQGGIAGDRDLIYQAIYFDPLTAAVLSLAEIRKMVDEMFMINKDWLPQFKIG